MSKAAGVLAMALGLFAGAALAAPVPEAPRSEIAVREVVLSDGTRRYGLPIKVGATAIEAGLDSGSSGLRVLPGVLAAGDADRAGGGDSYDYGSGTAFRGVVGKGQLTIGAASGASTLQLIDKVGCTAKIPKCPASRIAEAQFGVQGDGLPGEGFKAIIGVNMAEAEVATPLRAIGTRRWIIELPRPGEGTGRLILNPTEEEVQGYAMLPVMDAFKAQHGGLHDAVGGCLLNDATGKKVCGALLMDTGAPGLSVLNGGLGSTPWPQGPATLAFYDGRGRTQAAENLTLNIKAHASRLTFDSEPGRPGPVIYSGLTAYFAFSVLYDPERGMVGLKPRAPTPDGPKGGLVAPAP